jgi:hypothetical protein
MTVATADEIKLLFLEFQSAGVTFRQKLKKQPWGAKNFVVRMGICCCLLDPHTNRHDRSVADRVRIVGNCAYRKVYPARMLLKSAASKKVKRKTSLHKPQDVTMLHCVESCGRSFR